MTDFEYDNWQKKILAKNATKRKCGAKSKKCTLPSDYLTNKQIRERNGKIVSFNLNAPMAWSQYITLPDDIKKEYILTLRKKYNANQTVIAEMFGRAKSTISSEMKRLNLRMDGEIRMTKEEIRDFREWVAGDIADYCANDVLATEAVFHARKADFTARQILADVAGMSVNDTTNTLTTKIIFGNNKKPQDKFNYRDMGDTTQIFDPDADIPFTMGPPEYDEFTVFTKDGKPIFPGYKYERGVSTYRGEEAGEGGYVYSEPGMYWNVALLDIASMHPSSIIAETLFGPEYTKRFEEIKEARVAIKHKEFERAGKMLDGKLAKYLTDEQTADDLAGALKIAINSVYGLTSASFDNPFHDPRNKDNIVAKRGALFMINLKHEVMKRGFTVAHIKTDSIKIPNATPEIIKFVQDYGKLYGYNFEHEATYDRMCLVNDAVYIAKYATVEHCAELYGQAYVDSAKDILKDCKKHPGEWTATGTQFQVPYVFKKLFSREDILFEDLCETKSVTTSIYIDRSPEEAAIYINNPDVVKEDSEDILLDNGHSLHYVGKVGLFCPVKENTGGGSLVRQCTDKDGNTKYNSVTGSKGYLWMESEMVQNLGKKDSIDQSYYGKMVDEAVQTISQYGDFEQFVSDDSNAPDIPPWESPDEPWQETTNFDVR